MTKETKEVSEISERIILAACLINPSIYINVTEKIRSDHFYYKVHQTIYETYIKVAGNGGSLVPSNIEPALSDNERMLNIFRGIWHLEEEEDIKPDQLENAIKTVEDRYQRRKLIEIRNDLEDDLEDESSTPTIEIISGINDKLANIGDHSVKRQYTASEVLREQFPDPKHLEPLKSDFSGIGCNIKKMDVILNGAEPGDLIYIGGKPSEGKTQLALQWIVEAARKGIPCIIFSLETTKELINIRLLAYISGINSRKIQFRKIPPSAKDRWLKAWKELNNLPIIIDEEVTHSMMSMTNVIRKYQHKYGKVGLVVVDYIQLISSEHKELTEITRQLQNMAKVCHTSVIAISQLKRAYEFNVKEWTEKPSMHDFRESGSIEASARKMLAITNQPKDEDNEEQQLIYRSYIWVLKNKDGERDVKIPCMHHIHTGKFEQTRSFTRDDLRQTRPATSKTSKTEQFI